MKLEKVIRYTIFFALICMLILGGIFYNTHAYFDWGGVLSLIATSILLYVLSIVFNVYEGMRERIKKLNDVFWCVVILTLLIVGFIGIWLAVRSIGLLVLKLLFEERFRYTPTNIFTILNFILSANLCFTLMRSLEKIGVKKENAETDLRDVVKELNDVLIQVMIIGFIALLPRYSDPNLLFIIGGFHNFVILVSFMLVSLVVLIYARRKYFAK